MNTQKIQARGFTLVELIVVITILVILGTIAFLNLGGVSGSARDSQRISDLNQINTQITVTQAKNGIVYANLVTTSADSKALTSPSVAGVTPSASEYTAGDLNYAALGIDSAKMKDPTAKVAYKIGQTTLAGGAYELSAALEDNNGAKAGLVMGTYRARTQAETASSGAVVAATDTKITLTNTPMNFEVGDVIMGTTGTGKIIAISSDGKTLTLAGANIVAAAGATLKLAAADEMKGLTASGSSTANANAVTNKGTFLPHPSPPRRGGSRDWNCVFFF